MVILFSRRISGTISYGGALSTPTKAVLTTIVPEGSPTLGLGRDYTVG